MGEVYRKDCSQDRIIAVREWHPLLWQIQNERDMALPRPIRPQYIPSQEELMSEALQKKREVVQRFAEIIMMNDEGNTMPAHQIAEKAIEVYNKIEDYL